MGVDMKSIVEILADNLCSNMETVAQNRAARELSELTDQQLINAGISRQKLERGSEAYPWQATSKNTTEVDIEELLAQAKKPLPTAKTAFFA